MLPPRTVRDESRARRHAAAKDVGTAYTLERELGRGGMATRPRDAKHDRRVAEKSCTRSSGVAVAVDRFLHEIRIAATLQHPHILGLIDSGVLGDEWVSRARIRDAVSDAVLPEVARD